MENDVLEWKGKEQEVRKDENEKKKTTKQQTKKIFK